jgi:hypothetical protein
MTGRLSFAVAIATALAVGCDLPLSAQQPSISIAVDIQDSTNQFSSAFSSSLRQLGDVRVVGLSEQPDYVLSGVTICDPNCANLLSYPVALRLYAPMNRLTADMLVRLALRSARPVSAQVRDSLRAEFWQNLSFYEVTHGTWVLSWGRNRYEQGVRELVRDIDSRCFEGVRALQRAAASDDTAAFARYKALERSHSWIC